MKGKQEFMIRVGDLIVYYVNRKPIEVAYIVKVIDDRVYIKVAGKPYNENYFMKSFIKTIIDKSSDECRYYSYIPRK